METSLTNVVSRWVRAGGDGRELDIRVAGAWQARGGARGGAVGQTLKLTTTKGRLALTDERPTLHINAKLGFDVTQ